MVVGCLCLVALCSPAAAAAKGRVAKFIEPESLVAQPLDLPGFRYASREIHATTSPSRYAEQILGDNAREARSEIAFLRDAGFKEGVQEVFYGLPGEALSIAEVFSSKRGARHAFSVAAAEDVNTREAPLEKTFRLSSIPGADGFGGPDLHGTGGYSNVLFSMGHCLFLVGNALRVVTSSEQLDAVPDAGAVALYSRDRQRCR